MEENEGKSKTLVKRIVAGLFILAAISALAYAGYVYHRNSQRDEVLAWAKLTINSEPHVELKATNPSGVINSRYEISMERDSASSIELRHTFVRWVKPLIADPPPSWNATQVIGWTCRMDLDRMDAAEVKVLKVANAASEFPRMDMSWFSGFRYEGYPYWRVCLGKLHPERSAWNSDYVSEGFYGCNITPGSDTQAATEWLKLDSTMKCFEMRGEESAHRTANAFKAAIRLSGGKDTSFLNETGGMASPIATPREGETPQATDTANTNLDETSTASEPPTAPAPAPASASVPTYSDSLIKIESITTKPYYGGAILEATVHNKSPDTLDTIIINVNCFDERGVQTDNASFVFHDLAPNITAVKDMTGALNTVPARIQIVRVTHI